MAEKKENLLDEVKELDRKVRKHMVYKKMEDLKDMAHKVLELKYQTQIWLEELGVEEKDIKRIIDYINNEVALTKEEKAEIRDEINMLIKTQRREVVEDIKTTPHVQVMTAQSANTINAADYLTTGGTNSITNTSTSWTTDAMDEVDFEVK